MPLNPWHEGITVAFDVESTGVDIRTDRIVTACVVRIDPSADDPEKKTRAKTWLLNPGIDIPEGAAKIHGVTTERAREAGQEPVLGLLEIVNSLRSAWAAGWPVIGHNIPYDLSILEHELHRYSLGSIHSHEGPGYVIDTLAMDKLIRPKWRGKRNLTACCEAYGVRIDGAHDATFDALASARIAWRMANDFPTHTQLDLHELMDRQRRSHQSWAEEFGAYLKSQCRVDDISRDWPYTPATVHAERVAS